MRQYKVPRAKVWLAHSYTQSIVPLYAFHLTTRTLPPIHNTYACSERATASCVMHVRTCNGPAFAAVALSLLCGPLPRPCMPCMVLQGARVTVHLGDMEPATRFFAAYSETMIVGKVGAVYL